MRWVVTGMVLGSVSVLVVTLTMEQIGDAVGDRGGISVSGARSFLARLLILLKSIVVSGGGQLSARGRAAGQRLLAAIATGAGIGSRRFTSALRPRSRGYRLRFEECLQVTAPNSQPVARPSSLTLAPMPARPSFLARMLAVAELVAVIVVAGGVLALALVALGWKAARLF